jgi:hypothetical protein
MADLMQVGSGAASGAATGAAAGPYGAVIGGVIGAASAFFSGSHGTPSGSSEFDGLHSPTLPELAASSMKMGEVRIYKGYAQGLGISVEEVDLLMKLDGQLSGHSEGYVIDAWRNAYNPNLDNARIYLRLYNLRNPQAPIREGVLGPLSAGAVPMQAVVSAPTMAPASSAPLNSFTGSGGASYLGAGPTYSLGGSAPAAGQPTLADILKAARDGAIDAATKKALETQAGMNAKNAGFQSFLKDNQLIIAGAGAALVGAFAWALNRKK